MEKKLGSGFLINVDLDNPINIDAINKAVGMTLHGSDVDGNGYIDVLPGIVEFITAYGPRIFEDIDSAIVMVDFDPDKVKYDGNTNTLLLPEVIIAGCITVDEIVKYIFDETLPIFKLAGLLKE